MTRSYLTIDQRAYVVGDQGICPECEREVDFDDIDPNWYLCYGCVNELFGRGAAAVAHQRIADLQLPSRLGVDQGPDVVTGEQGLQN